MWRSKPFLLTLATGRPCSSSPLMRQYPISRSDPELLERLYHDVSDLLLPPFSNFHSRCTAKGIEGKYLRANPDELERRIGGMFR